jgi:hypothetical protein
MLFFCQHQHISGFCLLLINESGVSFDQLSDLAIDSERAASLESKLQTISSSCSSHITFIPICAHICHNRVMSSGLRFQDNTCNL